jgi:hypothetical protein
MLRVLLFMLGLSWVFSNVYAWSDHIKVINNTAAALSFSFHPDHHSGAHPATAEVAAHTASQSVTLTDGDWWQSDGDIEVKQNALICRYHYHGMANVKSLTQLVVQGADPRCQAASLITDNVHDCDGPHNCLIFNPPPRWVSLALSSQQHLADAEPLNRRFMLGTHNSSISSHYVDNGIERLVAMNQKLSMTEQLNLGVRSLEIDVAFAGNALRVCHFHTEKNPDILCFNNHPVSALLAEVNRWLVAHPHELLMLYFDINHPLGAGQKLQLEKMLQQTFAGKLYRQSLQKDVLDLGSLSVRQLLAKGWQVFAVSKANFDSSVLFSKAQAKGYLASVPEDAGIEHFSKATGSCRQRLAQVFAGDAEHASFWRLNGDRSVASKLVHSDDYITVTAINRALPCGLNMFSLDELVNGDARLAAQVWSWQQGYPQSQAGDVASLSAKGYFVNDQEPAALPAVLCYSAALQQWRVAPWNAQVPANDWTGIAWHAKTACHSLAAEGTWRFAVPVTPQQMLRVQKIAAGRTLLVNLHRAAGQWQANQGQALNVN